MFSYISVIDGFKVILGSYLLHVAAFLSMIIAVRPPDYTDNPEQTEKAKTIYYVLLTMHIVLAVLKYINIFVNKKLMVVNAISMFGVILIFGHLCEDWIFPQTAPV